MKRPEKTPRPKTNLLQTRVSDEVFAFVQRQAAEVELSAASWLRLKLVEMRDSRGRGRSS